MPFPRDLPSRADLARTIDAAKRRIGQLLILADAQATTGRVELARQTRMLVLLRQDELDRLRARHLMRRT